MFSFNFEKLDVWREAIEFANLIYKLTSKFPEHERFGLTNQMRRTAVSVSSNLAEGTSRISRVDFGRFVEIATGSLFEVVSQANISLNQRFLTRPEYERIISSAEKQCRMLSGLRRSLDQT
jgi:four helix bundle protein